MSINKIFKLIMFNTQKKLKLLNNFKSHISIDSSESSSSIDCSCLCIEILLIAGRRSSRRSKRKAQLVKSKLFKREFLAEPS